MRMRCGRRGFLLVAALVAPAGAVAQDSTPPDPAAPPAAVPPIYESASPLTVTFTANLGRLRRDKDEDAPWRAAVLSYLSPAGDTVRIPLRARTRGKWRLKNCDFPPLRLNFWRDSTAGTAFDGVDEPKLVVHCRDSDSHDEYVLQELQLYRVYNLVTPYSHRVRLMRATYADSGSGRARATRWAFLLEEPQALAARVGASRVETKGGGPGDVDPYQHAVHALFQYLIGNTDWSIAALHNAELFFKDGAYLPVAYDFDYSGAVNTEYALPPPALRLRSVRDRRYRGYCVASEHLPAVMALFQERKEAIYALYRDEIGQLLRPRTVETTLRYFDAFYETIGDPAAVRREIEERCLGSG